MFRPRPLAGAALAALVLIAPAAADAHRRPLAQKQFVMHAPGEARLAITAAAPGPRA
jgi:hypothetical protein